MAVQEVIVRLRAVGQRAFQSDMGKSARSVENVGKSAKTTSKRMGKSLGGFVGFSGAAAAAGKGLKDSITNAVDLGEQINKTSTVFRGPGAKSVLDFSKTTAKGIGISREQALQATGTFGNMLVPMGFARTRAADMSKRMVQLGGDMASFNNASPEDTLDAIRSGLAGETEPLRKFGVFLSEGRIKAQAMGMGLVKASKDTDKIRNAQSAADIAQRNYNKAVGEHGGKSAQAKQALLALRKSQGAVDKATKGSIPQLTAAQKAQATYGLIMKDTGDAQGDYARTSDSLANKQRTLQAQYADVTAQLGQKLLPALQWMSEHLTPLAVAVGIFAGAWLAYRTAVAVAAVAQFLMNTALLTSPITWIVLGVLALVAGFVLLYTKVGWFRTAVQKTWEWIKSHWQLLLGILLGPFGIAVGLIIKNFDKIKAAASTAAHWIAERFRDVVNFFKRLPGAIWGAIKGLGGKIKSALNPGGILDKAASIAGKIPGLQAGGTITRGGLTTVGEAGPELLALPTGASVIPAPALAGAGGPVTARFYLDRRLIASAVAQADADQRARR